MTRESSLDAPSRPISTSRPTRRCARSHAAGRHRRPGRDRRRLCPRPRRPCLARAGDEGRKSLRLFSTWEITRYLIPVATAHFRRVLKQNPDLPQGRVGNRGRGQVVHPSTRCCACAPISRRKARKRARNTCPSGPAGLPAKIVAVANFKGGVGKTSTCAHLAMSAALDGYRVLVVDLDSQGSMTSIFGGRVADEWQTVFPLIARHYATPPAGRQPRCGSAAARRRCRWTPRCPRR